MSSEGYCLRCFTPLGISGRCPVCATGVSDENPLGLGATGRYPRGMSRPDDEGELRTAIAGDPKKRMVHMDFGKSVQWLAMQPEQAEERAVGLIRAAKKARGE
jgi:hypothetical protein